MGGESRLPYWLLAGLLLCATPLFFISVSGGLLRHVPPELYAFGHVGLFGLVALLTLRTPALKRLAFGQRAALTLAAVLLLGGGLEVVQPLFGRSASLMDLWQNLVGAFAAIAVVAPGLRRRLILSGTALALLAVTLQAVAIGLWDRGVAYRQFPVLSDFSSRFDHRRWNNGTPDASIARVGPRSLRLDLEPGRYSGTLRRRSLGDWTGYQALELSLYLPDDPALVMTVSVRDHAHFERGGAYQDRFNRPHRLEQGWNTISIPIEDIRTAPRDRHLQLDDLAELVIFTAGLREPRRLYLDQVRLVR